MGACLVIGGVAALTWAVLSRHDSKPKAASQVATSTKPATAEQQLAYKSVAGKYLFSGTIVLDRVVVSAAKGDFNQPFSQMNTFGQFDAGIADLECPVTDAPNLFMINVDNPHFNCRPDWLPALKKYFPIVKLSGNHTYDKGADGFTSTVKNLQDAGIQAVGKSWRSPSGSKNKTAPKIKGRCQSRSARLTTKSYTPHPARANWS
jgi:hypothetical protein